MFSLWQISLILHTTVTEAEIVIVKPPGRTDESDPLLAQCYLCDLVSPAGRENNLARGSSFQARRSGAVSSLTGRDSAGGGGETKFISCFILYLYTFSTTNISTIFFSHLTILAFKLLSICQVNITSSYLRTY